MPGAHDRHTRKISSGSFMGHSISRIYLTTVLGISTEHSIFAQVMPAVVFGVSTKQQQVYVLFFLGANHCETPANPGTIRYATFYLESAKCLQKSTTRSVWIRNDVLKGMPKDHKLIKFNLNVR